MLQHRDPFRIFISYRRTDTSGHAGRLHDALSARFGRGNVFRDVGGLKPGVDFVEHIASELARCDVLLALIGPHWRSAADAHGSRRLDDPQDHVRREIEGALEAGVPVIPVLVNGAGPPPASELPESLAPLSLRQAHTLSEERWDHDVSLLVGHVKGMANARSRFSRSLRRQAIIGCLGLAVVAAVAVLAVVALGGSKGNAFASPSGLLRCRYFPAERFVGCLAANDGHVAFVHEAGAPTTAASAPARYSGSFGGGPALAYGNRWHRGTFECVEAGDRSGVVCTSLVSRQGFKICRDGVDVLPLDPGTSSPCYARG